MQDNYEKVQAQTGEPTGMQATCVDFDPPFTDDRGIGQQIEFYEYSTHSWLVRNLELKFIYPILQEFGFPGFLGNEREKIRTYDQKKNNFIRPFPQAGPTKPSASSACKLWQCPQLIQLYKLQL